MDGIPSPVTGHRSIIGMICRRIGKVGIGIAIKQSYRRLDWIGLDLDDWWLMMHDWWLVMHDWWFDDAWLMIDDAWLMIGCIQKFPSPTLELEHQNFQNPETKWNLNWKNPSSTFFEISSISWSISQKTRFLMENFTIS